MDLVEVDGVDGEAAERAFDLFSERCGPERAPDGAVGVPAHGTLGEDERLMAGGLERAADDFFRVAEAVDGRGVNPVDTEIEGAMDGGDGFVVVLGAPCEFPVSAADGPCAESDGGEVEVGVAELAKVGTWCCRRHRYLWMISDRDRLFALASGRRLSR